MPGGAGTPLLVAGGGGGGGVSSFQDTFPPIRSHGGGGGGGGTYPGDGAQAAAASNGGAGGRGGFTPGGNGEDAYDLDGVSTFVTPGGGGGAGWPNGGEQGYPGVLPNCVKSKGCPPGAVDDPGAGGGGGGLSYVDSSLPLLQTTRVGTNSAGEGSITFIGGAPQVIDCAAGTVTVPDDPQATGYTALLVGASGTTGANIGPLGRGGVVGITYPAPGDDQVFTAGCLGGGGDRGGSDGLFGYNGGYGGGSSQLELAGGGQVAVAGGGGGGGGDNAFGADAGGSGGDANSIPGSATPPSGGVGGYTLQSKVGGGGGCSGCSTSDTGDQGSRSDYGGGGGGGGAGIPGGQGGGPGPGWNNFSNGGGGGGGAGASYLVTGLTAFSWMTNQDSGAGYVLLWTERAVATTLTLTKIVDGAADGYATGPWVATVDCTDAAGRPVYDRVAALDPAAPTVLDDVEVGWDCTVAETTTGQASSSSPPQTTGPLPLGGASVAITNTYAAGALTVSVTSRVVNPDGTVNPDVRFALGDIAVQVDCRFEGRAIALPAPYADGSVRFSGTTLGRAAAETITGLPVGARCTVGETESAGATGVVYSPAVAGGAEPTVTIAAATTVDVSNSFALTTLSLAKTTDGDGVPPAGVDFTVGLSCTFRSAPVTLGPGTSPQTVRAGDTKTVAGLPVGADCTADETGVGGADATSYLPAATVAVTPAGAAGITVVNRYTSAPLVIALANRGAGAGWANLPVTVDWRCTDAGATTTGSVTLPAGGGAADVTQDVGTACTVTDVSASGRSGLEYATGDSGWTPGPQTVTVDADGGSLLLRATYAADRVDVAVTDTGAASAFANTPTTVTFGACRFNGLDVPVDLATGDRSVSYAVPAVGGALTTAAVVGGAVCTVSQDPAGGSAGQSYTVTDGSPSSTTSAGATLTVGAGAPARARVAIADDFPAGSLAVSVANAGSAAWAANAATTATVTCTFNGVAVPTLGPGGALVLAFDPSGRPVDPNAARPLRLLPQGAACEVRQTSPLGASVSYSPAGGDTSIVGAAAVQVVDTFTGVSLTTGAAVTGNAAADHAADVFTLDQSCTFNGLAIDPLGFSPGWQNIVDLVAGSSTTATDLPAGALCTVRALLTDHATSLSPAGGVASSGLVGADTPIQLVFGFDDAPVGVRLTTDGAGAPTYATGAAYDLRLRCTYPDGSRVTIPGADRIALTGPAAESAFRVPVDATCALASLEPTPASGFSTTDPIGVVGGAPNLLAALFRYDLTTITVTERTPGRSGTADLFRFDTTCAWTSPLGGRAIDIPLVGGSGAFALRNGGVAALRVLDTATCDLRQTDARGATSVVIDVDGVTTSGPAATLRPVTTGRIAVVVDDYLPGALPATGPAWIAAASGVGAALVVAALLLLRPRRRRS